MFNKRFYVIVILIFILLVIASLLFTRWVWTNDNIPLWLKIILTK